MVKIRDGQFLFGLLAMQCNKRRKLYFKLIPWPQIIVTDVGVKGCKKEKTLLFGSTKQHMLINSSLLNLLRSNGLGRGSQASLTSVAASVVSEPYCLSLMAEFHSYDTTTGREQLRRLTCWIETLDSQFLLFSF